MLHKRAARMRACTKGGDQQVWPAYLVAACCGRSLAFIDHGQSHPAQYFLFPLGPPGSSQIPQPPSSLQIQHSLSTNCVPRTRLCAGDTAPSRPQEAQCHPGDSLGWGLVEPSGEVAVTPALATSCPGLYPICLARASPLTPGIKAPGDPKSVCLGNTITDFRPLVIAGGAP